MKYRPRLLVIIESNFRIEKREPEKKIKLVTFGLELQQNIVWDVAYDKFIPIAYGVKD